MTGKETDDSERNEAEWVLEGAIEDAKKSGNAVASGAYCVWPVEGTDTIHVYKFDHAVHTDT